MKRIIGLGLFLMLLTIEAAVCDLFFRWAVDFWQRVAALSLAGAIGCGMIVVAAFIINPSRFDP